MTIKRIILNPDYVTANFGLAIYTDKGLSREYEGPRWTTMADMDHDWARIMAGLNTERNVPKYVAIEKD